MATIKEVFDRIAPSWYNFRHWSIFRLELEALAQRWQRGRLLNVGCGHGADFLPFRQGFELHGVDFSPEMLRYAQKYAGKFHLAVSLVEADAGCLPYPDGGFDWAIAVATYHHIEGRGERLQALRELRRVLRPGGEAFVTAWNRWQPRFWFRRHDIAVPWRTKEVTFMRYYHLFSYRELQGLAQAAGFEVLRAFPESSYRFPLKCFSRNVCLLLRK
ncbi:MAG: methyltransferase domain-containing protein [Chloroflexota bacterium]